MKKYLDKKKKGFTLIELLAVLVIMAVLALIIIPVINNVIENAKYGAFKATSNGILSSAKDYYAGMLLNQNVKDTIFQYDEGNLVSGVPLSFSGKVPEKVYVELNELQQIRMYAWDKNGYCAVKSFTTQLVYTNNTTEENCKLDVPTVPILSGGVDDWVNSQTISIETESISIEEIKDYEYYLSSSNESLISGSWASMNDKKNILINGEHEGYMYMRAVTISGVKGEISLPERIMTSDLVHTITINISGSGTATIGKTKVKYGENVVVTTNPDYNNKLTTLTYNDTDFLSTKSFVMPNIDVTINCVFEQIVATGSTWNYGYSGGQQKFTAPINGTYTLEVWGAQGSSGDGSCGGGGGGYVSAKVNLDENAVLYIYVGGEGGSCGWGCQNSTGGYNGGGNAAVTKSDGSYSGGGGGGTDIRFGGTGIGNRIIVAGGGGAGSGGGKCGGAGGSSYNNGVNSGDVYQGRSGNNDGGGGGGGYYGGDGGEDGCCGGYGGSNYFNTNYGTLNSSQAGVHGGNGYAKITFTE